MSSNDEIITYFNNILKNTTSTEKEKIERLSAYYKRVNTHVKLDKRRGLTRSTLNENDWTYIFSKTYPNCYYYSLPDVRVWMMAEVYQNLDEISKIVLKQLIIF